MRITNISTAKATLSKLVAEVEAGGEVILSRAGKPVAKIIAFQPLSEPRNLEAGTWKGRVKIADGFDELATEFMEHFTAAGTADSDA